MIALLAGIVSAALYLGAVRAYNRRFPKRAFAAWRIVTCFAGITLITVALMPQADALADRSFAAHMVQHVVLVILGPPLILLGAPLLLLVAVPAALIARRIARFAHSIPGQAIFAPITGWLLFVVVLWGAHFSPLYEAALNSPYVHVAEHVLFLSAAFLFWAAVIQTGFVPRAVPFPARMLYVFLAIPQGAFLGLAIYAARGVLYPHYLHSQSAAEALADQQNAGAVMWILGGFFMFVAFMLTAGAWAFSERGAAART